MNRRIAILVPAAALALAFAILAGRAAANSSAFSFTMEKRAVWGNKNKKYHALDAGELKLSGGVWVVSKRGGATSTPAPVTFEVHKGQEENKLCSVSVTPSTTFNDKRTFDKSCGRVESGTYWIFVVRDTEDGWQLKGSGSLSTK